MITRARAAALLFGGSLLPAIGISALGQSGASLAIMGAIPSKALLDALVPAFEKAAGRNVAVQIAGLNMATMIAGGAPFDVVITSTATLDSLTKAGWVLPDPQVVLGSSIFELAYRSGTSRPDISTPAALKAAVLNAKTISYSDPAGGGASSVYFVGLMQQLGIADDVARKAMLTKVGEGAVAVADGRADIGVAQTTEIALSPGVAGVPLNPSDPKSKIAFAAGVSAKSANAEAARAFVRYLQTPDAVALRKAKGFVIE